MEDGLKVTGVVGSRETGQAAMEVNSSNRKKNGAQTEAANTRDGEKWVDSGFFDALRVVKSKESRV